MISGYTDATSLGVITQLLSDASGRWSPASMQYGHAFGAVVDTLANLTQDGASWNDQHRTIFGLVGSPTPPWEAAAAIVGAVYPSLKADPLRPLQTLPVLGVMAPPASTAPVTVANKQALLSDGVAMVQWDQGGNCTVLRAVTTYQKNAYGVADTNYLDTETLFGLMTFVRRLNAAYTNTYPRSKLADNGTHFGAGSRSSRRTTSGTCWSRNTRPWRPRVWSRTPPTSRPASSWCATARTPAASTCCSIRSWCPGCA